MYVHTNLGARDWRTLAAFYEQVFGCTMLLPERNLSGGWLEEAIGVAGVAIRGVHLRLPGYGLEGPTLEIFEYQPSSQRGDAAINRPGYGHIAFRVADVVAACEAVLQGGGRTFGKLVTIPVKGAGVVTFVYVTDPEGNVIELQSWAADRSVNTEYS
jgi:catechol 2,3-dioxygenase-like lactoylglutathione lyase family enzyme